MTPPAPDLLHSGPDDAGVRLLLGHGAGAPMTSPFLETVCALLAARGIAATRFEFAYMAARRMGARRRPPPRAETLAGEYEAAVQALENGFAGGGGPRRPRALLIGGKSMGGRVASLVADSLHREGRVAGLVCLGYPFHPTAKPAELRIAHLAGLATPALIVQGERDPFGNRIEIEALALSPRIAFSWIGDGDHDLGPRGASGFTRKGNLAAAADAIANFAATL